MNCTYVHTIVIILLSKRNRVFKMTQCNACGDTGVIFIGCCSGSNCGCLGYPVLAKNCKCGHDVDESKMPDSEKLFFKYVEFQDEIIK